MKAVTSYTDGYYTYIDKSKVNVRAIRFGLMYGDHPSEGVVVGDHIRVPRHFKVPNVGIVDRTDPYEKVFTCCIKTQPRDYQVDPLNALCEHGGGILNLGCGYGKTVISCYFIGIWGRKTAILVDKVNLIHQWKDELLTHLDITEDQIGVVQGKKWDWEKDIVLCSLHTLARRGDDVPEGFYESFGLAVFDECHHLAAKTFKSVVPRFGGSRLGLSATPHREDGLEEVFMNHLGPVIYSKVDQELIPKVYFIQTDIDESFSEKREVLDRSGEVNHRRLCHQLGEDPERDLLVRYYIRALLDCGHHVLCLSHSVDHVNNLVRRLASEGITAGVAAGDVPAKQRSRNIKDNRVSIATVDVAAEALNVPSLSALVVLTPFGARQHGNTLQQALGRIQRIHAGKRHPVALFFEDRNVGMCKGLMRQVKKALHKQGYEFENRQPRAEINL